MTNPTMLKFGYPDTLIHQYDHWAVLLRPAQVTLGSLILAATSEATAFGQLPAAAHAELATATRDIEATLASEIGYQKINYLMLMMVDPHVHFHVLPRYEGSRAIEGIDIADTAWPGPPDLKSGQQLDRELVARLCRRFTANWVINR